jgi:hypothetical protein
MIAVGFGKGTVNGDRLAASFEWRFAFLDLHRHVTVNDQALCGIHTELFQDPFGKPHFMDQVKIRVFSFVVGFFVFD